MKTINLFVILIASLGGFAVAGPRVNNGGGAWVCRAGNQSIQWIQLGDLFEAKAELNLQLIASDASAPEIVKSIETRIANIDVNLFNQLKPRFERINNLQEGTSNVAYTNDPLPLTNDFLFRTIPEANTCANGTLNFEQIVNYGMNDAILVQRQLFAALSNLNRAALVVHEAIYANRRAVSIDQSSINSRRMVGILFSTLTNVQAKVELAKADNAVEIHGAFVAVEGGAHCDMTVFRDSAGNRFGEKKCFGVDPIFVANLVHNSEDYPIEKVRGFVTDLNSQNHTNIDPTKIASYKLVGNWGDSYGQIFIMGEAYDADSKLLGLIFWDGSYYIQPSTKGKSL